MDIDMDVDYDAGASVNTGAQQPAPETAPATKMDDVPAAYFEDLGARPIHVEQWPDHLNLQGVSNFDPNDPLYYAMEHCLEPRVKQTRWINDNSVNLQYYSAEDAAIALQALTDPSAGDPASISSETARKARPYSKRPEIELLIRQANAGDQKARGAANRSAFYKHNPDLRGGDHGREREPRRRQPPRRDYLNYEDLETPRPRAMRSVSGDERMRDDSDYDSRRRGRNDRGDRNGMRDRDHGRLKADTDTYRPDPNVRGRESRYGRLRNRSASPDSGGDGDGRYGFTEQGTSTHTRYRSRSRSRNNQRRRRDPSGERWEHDRATFGESGTSGRWTKDSFDLSPELSKHRRSDAFDETSSLRKGSLLDRMTKNGRPLAPKAVPLASRITRDDDGSDDSYGRLKDDDDFHAAEFSEFPPRDLNSRITRENDGMQIRGRGEQNEGINIRGASNAGFSIRGVAGGH